MKETSSKKISILFVLLSIVMGAIGFYAYNLSLNKNLSQSICDYINEIILQQKINIELGINWDENALENIARAIEVSAESQEEAFMLVSEMIVGTNYDNMFIVGLDGKGRSLRGIKVDVSNRDYFVDTLKNNSTTIGTPIRSYIHNNLVTPVATPIYDGNGEIQAVLVGSYTIQKLAGLLLPTFSGNGYTYILTTTGEIIASSEVYSEEELANGINIFDKLMQVNFEEFGSVESFKEDIANQHPGHMTFSVDGRKRYAHYEYLGINDWYVMLAVDHSIVAASANIIKNDSLKASIAIFLSFGLVFLYYYCAGRKSNKIYTQHLYSLAYYDKLTGLPNVEKFKKEIKNILYYNPDKQFSCTVFDINNFKFINDTYGYAMGDRVLKTVSDVCENFINSEPNGTAAVCRFHSDTFAVFVITDYNFDISNKRFDFLNAFRSNINFIRDYKIDLSLGRYLVQKGDTPDTIIERTNIAHAKAQKLTPNTFIDYSVEEHTNLKAQVIVRNKIEAAINNNEFEIFLQPKFSFKTGNICGAEALTRWKHEDDYLIPDNFIPILEQKGLIIQLDLYVFEKCCELIKQWQSEGKTVIPLAVNFSRHHFASADFADKLNDITQKFGISNKNFIIEFTENVAVENQESVKYAISQLHKHNFFVSMDDFGSGYSSLGFLDEILVDEIKLDRSFIKNISNNKRTYAIVESIINMTKKIGTRVVAEGIETKIQNQILNDLECDIAQGFYYSPAVPSDYIFSLNLSSPTPNILSETFNSTTTTTELSQEL